MRHARSWELCKQEIWFRLRWGRLTLLNSIKNKSFQPDLSRSGMVTPVPRQPEETAAPFTPGLPRIPAMQKFVEEPQFDAVSPTDHEPSMENDIGEKSRFEHAPSETADLDNEVGSFVTDESSESSSEAQTSGSEERQLTDPPACLETDSADLTFYYINEKTLVVHVPKTREIHRCGRKISLNMRSSFEKNGIKCSGCFTENSWGKKWIAYSVFLFLRRWYVNLAKCLLAEANPCLFVLQQDKVESVKQLLACGKTCVIFLFQLLESYLQNKQLNEVCDISCMWQEVGNLFGYGPRRSQVWQQNDVRSCDVSCLWQVFLVTILFSTTLVNAFSIRVKFHVLLCLCI